MMTRVFAPIFIEKPVKSMKCSINWDKLSATHSPRARTVRTPQLFATHPLQRTVRPPQVTRSVRATVWDTGIPPPQSHCLAWWRFLALVMRSAFLLRPSILHHLALCRRSRLCRVRALAARSVCFLQALILIVPKRFCPLPILDFQVAVCLVCDHSRTTMWAPPALDCLACPGKHAPMDAADFTDNAEDSIEDGARFVPRKRRDLKKDATSLWHLLTHTPANKFCPICNHAKAQQVRHIRGPAGDTHKAERLGDTITADYLFFDRHSDDVGIGVNANGLVILDVATRYLGCDPSESRDADITEMSLRCFAGDVKVRRFDSNNH